MVALLLAVVLTWLRALSLPISHHCKRLVALAGGKSPEYLAVLSNFERGKGAAEWTAHMPVPVLAYSSQHNVSSFYRVHKAPRWRNGRLSESLMDSAVKISYFLDHFTCLPQWTLFLSSQGRQWGTGSTPIADHLVVTHPLSPAVSSALLDVSRISRSFLSVGHLHEKALRNLLKPAASGFGARAHKGTHRMAFRSIEEGSKPCRSCKDKLALARAHART